MIASAKKVTFMEGSVSIVSTNLSLDVNCRLVSSLLSACCISFKTYETLFHALRSYEQMDVLGPSTRCLSFSYHMNGAWQFGTLTVSIVLPGSIQPIKHVAVVTKHEQSRSSLTGGWKKEMKEITHNTSYQVRWGRAKCSKRISHLEIA